LADRGAGFIVGSPEEWNGMEKFNTVLVFLGEYNNERLALFGMLMDNQMKELGYWSFYFNNGVLQF